MDTSQSYHYLLNQLKVLTIDSVVEIDSMGRFYNEKENKIMLPLNDEDGIYAGDYFFPRFAKKRASIEYLTSYWLKSTHKNLAIVLGIFETEQEARDYLIRKFDSYPSAFIIESEVYIGCSH